METVLPALRLRALRPQLRAAQPAPLLVQQPARLVPDVRGARRPARRERRPCSLRDTRLSLRAGRRRGVAAADGPVGLGCRSPRRWRGTPASRLDTPYAKLAPAQQRAILHGTGEAWIELDRARERSSRPKAAAGASRSPLTLPVQGPLPRDRRGVAGQLRSTASGSITWSTRCPAPPAAGSRLRPDAAATRFDGLTLGELCATCRSARRSLSSRT